MGRAASNGHYPQLLALSVISIVIFWYWAAQLQAELRVNLEVVQKWVNEHSNDAGRPNKEERHIADSLERNMKKLDAMGRAWTTFDMLDNLFEDKNHAILSTMRKAHTWIQKHERNSSMPMRRNMTEYQYGRINVAAVSCDSARQEEFMTMLKSATMFSQDTGLHFIIFSDEFTILDVAQDVLELKWTVNALGWDFTYELHLEWFPNDGRDWRAMYTPCATQRLFFPTLLPHIDALIYLDADIVVMSNLTEFWLEFPTYMKDKKMAAMASNNEITVNGWYNTASKIPHYGPRGLNAGVMMMNLTQMRAFNFQERAMAAQVLYDGKIVLADQDIVNIIFHGFPERLHQLPCSYNFNWVYCGRKDDSHMCKNEWCFCNATFTNGVQILHGNSGTFYYEEILPFVSNIYKQFFKFDLLTDSPAQLMHNLRTNFTKWDKPCGPLTANILFDNAENYLRQVNPQSFQNNR